MICEECRGKGIFRAMNWSQDMSLGRFLVLRCHCEAGSKIQDTNLIQYDRDEHCKIFLPIIHKVPKVTLDDEFEEDSDTIKELMKKKLYKSEGFQKYLLKYGRERLERLYRSGCT